MTTVESASRFEVGSKVSARETLSVPAACRTQPVMVVVLIILVPETASCAGEGLEIEQLVGIESRTAGAVPQSLGQFAHERDDDLVLHGPGK